MRISIHLVGLALALGISPVCADPALLSTVAPGADEGVSRPTDDQMEGERFASLFCSEIERTSEENSLPPSFMARLIWKESRFDPSAVSPVGAQGIAQFMPGTARDRRLGDPFDPQQALTASADYLGELRVSFGNLGLAAAAYNAGEQRVRNWLAGLGSLPAETEDYVLVVTGRTPDEWSKADASYKIPVIGETGDFAQRCRHLVLRQHLPKVSNIEVPDAAASTLRPPDASTTLAFASFPTQPEAGLARSPHFDDRDRAYRKYRAQILQALKRGPNFAGHFTVLGVSCGGDCAKLLIIDRLTGHVRELPAAGGVNYASTARSSLLLTSTWNSSASRCEVKAYSWEKFTSHLIASSTHSNAEVCARGTRPEEVSVVSSDAPLPHAPSFH